jgi:hypothetical protein
MARKKIELPDGFPEKPRLFSKKLGTSDSRALSEFLEDARRAEIVQIVDERLSKFQATLTIDLKKLVAETVREGISGSAVKETGPTKDERRSDAHPSHEFGLKERSPEEAAHLEFSKQRLERLLIEMRDVTRQVSEAPESEKQGLGELADEVSLAVSAWQVRLRRLLSMTNEAAQRDVIVATTLDMRMQLSEAEAFVTAIKEPESAAPGKRRNLAQRILDGLVAIFHRWTRLVVGLMTPKEWTLKGEVGAALFGLASAGVEIKFGA